MFYTTKEQFKADAKHYRPDVYDRFCVVVVKPYPQGGKGARHVDASATFYKLNAAKKWAADKHAAKGWSWRKSRRDGELHLAAKTHNAISVEIQKSYIDERD